MPKSKSRRPKSVPVRTCVVCRATQAKRQLIRVVRLAPLGGIPPSGVAGSGVQLDPTGKLAGRGAYLCHNRSCWEQALRSNRLSAALKTTLTAEETSSLRAYAALLPESVAAGAEARASAE